MNLSFFSPKSKVYHAWVVGTERDGYQILLQNSPIHKVTERYHKLGKTVYIRHLSSSSRVLLEKAETIINVNYTDDDPSFKIVFENRQKVSS